MAVKVFAAARERLFEIWDYTEQRWGEAKADAYVNDLLQAVADAHHARHLWRHLPAEELSGVHFIRFQHHFIFFRELPRGVLGIVSILHESMNIPLRLKKDTERPD